MTPDDTSTGIDNDVGGIPYADAPLDNICTHILPDDLEAEVDGTVGLDQLNNNEVECNDDIQQNPNDSIPESNDSGSEVEQLPPLWRSSRGPTPITRMDPSTEGQRHQEIILSQVNPDSHLFHSDLDEVCFTQSSLTRGLELFEAAGEASDKDELSQLHGRETFIPIPMESIPMQDRIKVLEYHLFLEKKRDGIVKVRLAEGVNKQREFTSKYDVVSPTFTYESVFITSTIEEAESRDVDTFDIPNAFIQEGVSDTETIYMCLSGRLAKMVAKIYPDVYKQYLYVTCKGHNCSMLILTKNYMGLCKRRFFL